MPSTTASLPVAWHEDYEVDIGHHVFPTRKFRLVRDCLVDEGTIAESDILRPAPATDAQVGLTHTADYIEKINEAELSFQEQMVLEVPFSAELRDGMWLIAGGSILTARMALEAGVATHIGGGFHHAFADHGEGFCLINDIAIAIRVLLSEEVIERAMVLDCDVHHGNGTAAIFREDPAVFTFSMHQQNNYPQLKPAGDLDLGLADGIGDEEYVALIDRHVPEIVERHKPQLAFYLAGADPYKDDQLGGLDLTLAGLRARDRTMFSILREAGVPVAVNLAGGYAANPADTIEIHCSTVREASDSLRA